MQRPTKKPGKPRQHGILIAPTAVFSLLPLIAAGLLTSLPARGARIGVAVPAAAALPVPSTHAARPFVFAGAAGVATAGNAMTVTSTSRATGLNWDSFNIGASVSVNFAQPDAASRVLNRIWSADPSVIMGKLNSNGQVYLINQNGILFGGGSQVNVGGLVASSLGVSDDLLHKGLPANPGEFLRFNWEGNAAGFTSGFVAIDPGATITTPAGSKVVLLAPRTAENLGRIEAGAGSEVILGAGGSVLLTAPDDPNLRGLLVEVQPWKGTDALGNSVGYDGVVNNRADGSVNSQGNANGVIATENGVVSLAALAVNQRGTVSAGKAVNLNGQIMLVSGTQQTDRLTINQVGNTAQIDWTGGFNVNEGKTVEFVQPSAGAVAYNFVVDGDRLTANPGGSAITAGRSTIDGKLTANGQIFIINEKGIDFGAKSVVAASNFVASGLGINPDVVSAGIFAQDGVTSRAFYLNKDQWRAPNEAAFAGIRDQALIGFREASVKVAEGANITTSQGGFAILAGSQVEQGGTINTPDGQTLLAAGADLYLKPPYSQVLRGFTAEVNPLYVVEQWNNDTWHAVSRGSGDANRITQTGTINALLGNITLVGNEIVQGGTLAASTSSTSNGSIRLLARDMVTLTGLKATNTGTSGIRKRDLNTGQILSYGSESGGGIPIEDELFVVGLKGGALTLGSGSKTEVAVDGSDGRTTKSDQSFLASTIDAAAATIDLQGRQGAQAGAQVAAKGGRISLSAFETFGIATAFAGDPVGASSAATPSVASGVFVGDGARLDASGSNASKSVGDLFVRLELRGDEFAANPVQRSGTLRGQTAYVDIRDKVSIADLSGYFNVEKTVEERTAIGGDIALRSTGSIIVKPGAEINVSGGRVDYAAGQVQETRAYASGGQSFRLNDAPTDLAYAGLITRSRAEAAYTEGKSAGSVELTGHNIALGGDLLGNTVRGDRQLNIGNPASDRTAIPLGAKLTVRDGGQHFQPAGTSEVDKSAAYGTAQIAFVNGKSTTADELQAGDMAGPLLELSSGLIESGFSRFDIQSDGRIDIPAAGNLILSPGGEFKARGRQIQVAGDIIAPGGKVELTTRDMSTSGNFPTEAKYSTLVVAGSATISTAGLWVNDGVGSAGVPRAIQGGNISLESAYDLDVRAGASLDVSGGARLKADGKLDAGNAGNIKLKTGGVDKGGFDFANPGDLRDASLFLDGSLSAYALGTGNGGTLEVSTSTIGFYNPTNLSPGPLLGPDPRTLSRAGRLARGWIGAAFSTEMLNQGGFYGFKFLGRDGVAVQEGAQLVPNPLSWTFAGDSRYAFTPGGAPLASAFNPRQLNLATLHQESRLSPTSLSLATNSMDHGDLEIGAGALLRVDALGSINLESWRQLTVLGTLEAPAGSIRLVRPASSSNPGNNQFSYSEAFQSRSIFLGDESVLSVAGIAKLDASTRGYLEAGVSADILKSRGLYRGQVLAGGTVDIDAGLGYLISRPGSSIKVQGGSDALNAAQASGNRLSYATLAVQGSAGGRVLLSARDGMFLDGGYQATGGPGAPAGIFSLRFSGEEGNPWDINVADTPATLAARDRQRSLTLYQSAGKHLDLWPTTDLSIDDYLAGSRTLDPFLYNGKARLDVAPLIGGGFGSWYLQSQHEIGFDGNVSATLNNQLRLDANAFVARSDATKVDLTAAAVQIGNYGSSLSQAAAASAKPKSGSAEFSIKADPLETNATRDLALTGNFTWSGFGTTTFASLGDIHLDSMPNNSVNRSGGRNFNGLLKGSGNMWFSAARLAPATFSDFVVDLASDTGSRLNITRQGTAGPLLSAAGRLEFKAANIVQEGTVAAPLGEIVFSSPDGEVTLGAGSLTTVAADRLLPLGQTDQSGRHWNFVTNSRSQGGAVNSVTYTDLAAPEKSVRIDASRATVKSGATIDLSGGGEAYAKEFTPGPGGKIDLLAAATAQEPSVFAVLPGWQGGYVPPDSQALGYYDVSRPHAGSVGTSTIYDPIPSLRPGDQINLAASPGGPVGTYTLLPASYALMPGAFLVTVKPSQDRVLTGAQGQADGSYLVAGQRLATNADGSTSAYSAKPLTLEVASRDVMLNRGKYTLTRASDYFQDQSGVQLPGDAGRLSVLGRTSLEFDPVIYGTRPDQILGIAGNEIRASRGAELDLAAPRIAVTDAGTSAPDASWSVLDKDKLNALGAASLLLGGIRSVTGGTVSIDTRADEVRIVTSGDTALRGSELLLTAKDEVRVVEGSRLAASGKDAASGFVLTGDSAFLRLAGGEQATIKRLGVDRLAGNLVLETGSVVQGRALIFDATHDNTLAGKVLLRNDSEEPSDGGAISIGARRVNIVGDSSAPADGLTLDNARLADMGKPDELRIVSYTTLDLYGPAVLGTEGLKNLVIGAAGIAGHGSAGDTAKIQGVSVRLENPNPQDAAFAPGAVLGETHLEVNALQIVLGGNATRAMRDAGLAGFRLRGFDTVNLTSGELRFEGMGVTEIDNLGGSDAAAAVTANAGRVVTADRANHLISASGDGVIGKNPNAGAVEGTNAGLGGALEVRAKTLEVSGRIEAPGGRVILVATGTAANDNITIIGSNPVIGVAGAVVAAEGKKVSFADTAAFAPGGEIVLRAATGNVEVQAGAVISVSADAAGGDAGKLSLLATAGTVSTAAGTLRGIARVDATGLRQGQLVVDARTVAVDDLADAVIETFADGTAKSHFTGQIDIRQRSGSLELTGTLNASHAILATDNGGITVAATGKIDASGAKGGEIELYTRNGDLKLSGELRAMATQYIDNASNQGTRGEGGTVTLGASGGKVITEIGSMIKVGPAPRTNDDGSTTISAAQGGKVIFRAGESAAIANKSDLNIQLAGGIKGAADIAAEIVTGFSGTSLTADATSGDALGLTSIRDDLKTAYSAANVTTLRSHLASSAWEPVFHVRPGVEIITSNSSSDFTISADLDFNALRFPDAAGGNTEPGALTIKATRDLLIDNSISDGFIQASGTGASFRATGRDARINSSGSSWSYRLVSGADATAANPAAVAPPPAVGATDVTDPLALKGSIIVAASKLVRTGTGDITLAARRDVTLLDRAIMYTAGRNDTRPFYTTTSATGDPTFKPAPSIGGANSYNTGGGDFNIKAGENIAGTATGELTDWLIPYNNGFDSTQWLSRVASFQQGIAAFGGGDVSLAAGTGISNMTVAIPTNGRIPGQGGEIRDNLARINGGGDISVQAGTTIDSGLFYAETGSLRLQAGESIVGNARIALGNTSARVIAGGGANLGNISNPLATFRNTSVVKSSAGGVLTGGIASGSVYRTRIGTYGDESAIELTSIGGDVGLNADGIADNGVAPSRVKIAALGGNIAGNIAQMPGNSGQLDLLAAGGIKLTGLTQYDLPESRLPTLQHPLTDINTKPFAATAAGLSHASSFWHLTDVEPSRLIALGGDITGSGGTGTATVAAFNEAVRVEAGGDIKELSVVSQHIRADEVSRIAAGRDIVFPTGLGLPTKFQINGPGRLEVIAGGSIDLGTGTGIVSRGNLENFNLPEGGANLFVLAGSAAPDYVGFRNYLKLGADVSEAALRDRFYQMLRDYGVDAKTGGGEPSYEMGRQVILALFPSAAVTKANIDLFYSQIKTEQGGNIDLMAPGGGVTVGIATPNQTLLKDKKASEQGLFTVRDGAIRAFVKNNFLVNQSRVFTLDGGDILVWADQGSIDAGSGAKTVSATPPPTLVIRDGQVVLDTSNSVSGSGIGVLASKADTPASSLYLFAPKGAIDAGDAGLRSTGNVFLGAQQILNSANIQAGGTVAGAPAQVAVPAPAAAPSNTAASKINDLPPTAAGAANQNIPLAMLTVEVLEPGEGSGLPPGTAAGSGVETNPASEAPPGDEPSEEEKKRKSGEQSDQ